MTKAKISDLIDGILELPFDIRGMAFDAGELSFKHKVLDYLKKMDEKLSKKPKSKSGKRIMR